MSRREKQQKQAEAAAAAAAAPAAPAVSEATDEPLKEFLLDLGSGLHLYRLHVDAMREQDVNARSMPPAMMQRLQATIARDSRLESLPLVADTGGVKFEVVSGHHRVRAARAAELGEILALVDVTGLTPSQVKAKQLAHNAIQGYDEVQLVQRIFEQIDDVDARLEAHIDPKVLTAGVPDKVTLPKLDLDIDFRTTLITFLPHQSERFDRAVDTITSAGILEDRDKVYVVDLALYERWSAAMSRLRKEFDARAISVVIAQLLDAVAEVLGIEGTDPADLDPAEWVPLSRILGSAMVPPDAVAVIQEAVDKIAKQEEIKGKHKWRALEYLCADYLAGP